MNKWNRPSIWFDLVNDCNWYINITHPWLVTISKKHENNPVKHSNIMHSLHMAVCVRVNETHETPREKTRDYLQCRSKNRLISSGIIWSGASSFRLQLHVLLINMRYFYAIMQADCCFCCFNWLAEFLSLSDTFIDRELWSLWIR